MKVHPELSSYKSHLVNHELHAHAQFSSELCSSVIWEYLSVTMNRTSVFTHMQYTQKTLSAAKQTHINRTVASLSSKDYGMLSLTKQYLGFQTP